jgi:parvulin-like peptidyl-prolyl isomerase
MKIVRLLREENASFCAGALESSKGRSSKEKGGFLGIRFLVELMPEMIQSVSEAKEGEVLEPIVTKLGYHIIKVEKWFPVQLDESLREQLLESAF